MTDEAAMLRNLLARIHRDGGQHTEKVGLGRSFLDADRRVATLNANLDATEFGKVESPIEQANKTILSFRRDLEEMELEYRSMALKTNGEESNLLMSISKVAKEARERTLDLTVQITKYIQFCLEAE